MAGVGRTPINVTPLIDVVLVLLIIFMVITPLMDDDKDIELPEVPRYEPPEGDDDGAEDPVTVLITEAGEVWIAGAPVALDQVPAHIGAATAGGARKVRVKGDRRLEAQAVLPVLEALRAGGARQIALGVEEGAP